VKDYSKWDDRGMRKRKKSLTDQYHKHTRYAANAKQIWEWHRQRARNLDREIARIDREMKRRAK